MNPTHDEILFVSFCVEMYARRHEMSGEAVMRLFDGLRVCEFLVESYDPLHSLRDKKPMLQSLKDFYLSPVYARLEQEESKYWWMSPAQLAQIS